jgi:hypothetical protein
LSRFSNGNWVKLSTRLDKEDLYYSYYSAYSPGFSLFAITSEKKNVEETINAKDNTSIESKNQTKLTGEVIKDKESVSLPGNVTAKPVPIMDGRYFAYVISLLVVAVAFFLTVITIWRKRKLPGKSKVLNLFEGGKINLIKKVEDDERPKNADIRPPPKSWERK